MDKIPITTPYFDDTELSEIKTALESGWVAQGPRVSEFEEMVSNHEGIKHGIATTSCTTALQLAIRALGVGKGHDVIVPAYTFIATANAAVCEGAVPVFTDVDPRTYNMDIASLEDVISRYKKQDEKLVNPVTGNILNLIIPVHLFGLCANIPAINWLADEYGLSVLEDSACALGAKIGKRHQGTFGNMSCLSFHPRKSITTGEGGMVLTNIDSLSDKMRSLRNHGASIPAYERHEGVDNGYLLPDFNEQGYNFRMTDIQAAMGIAQMKKLDYIIEERRKKANYYDRLLEGQSVASPYSPDDYFHTYQSYVCMLGGEITEDLPRANKKRDEIMLDMARKGISTRIGTHALHNTGYYKKRFGLSPSDFQAADRCEKLSVTLPLSVNMTNEQQEYVVDCLLKLLL